MPAEAYVFETTAELLQLLQIGIPYDAIQQMSEEDIAKLLGVHWALTERNDH